MKFFASADRRQELMCDMRSLINDGGEEALRRIYVEFCARKRLEPLLNSSNIAEAVADHVLGMKKHYQGQFRQSVCRAKEGANQ